MGVISESIQKIIHCKYIIYFLYIFEYIYKDTQHYTLHCVFVFLQNNWEGLSRELKKEIHQYYKINRREFHFFFNLLSSYSSVLLVEALSLSPFSYLSSSSNPLFLEFTSVHTFLQEQRTVLECQPLELDHPTTIVDCKATNMRTRIKKKICVFSESRRIPGKCQFIQSIQNSFFMVPVLSFKTSCECV